MGGGGEGVEWDTQGMCSFSGHGPIVNMHRTLTGRITVDRDEVMLYK